MKGAIKTAAKVISRISGPLVGLPIWLILIVVFANTSLAETLREIVILATVAFAIPAAYLVFAFRRHSIEDLEISKREQRPVFFFLITFFHALAAAVAFAMKFPEEVIAFLFIASVLALVYSVITLFWKISMHILSGVIWATLLAYIFGPWWFLIGIAILPIAWSRLYLRLHTLPQMVTSLFLAVIVLMLGFAIYPRHEYQISELYQNGGKFVDVDGVSFHYIDKGQGKPLLFLHGFALSTEAWKSQIDEFSKNYRVIALDLPGFGYSDRSFSLNYSRQSQGEFVNRFMETVHITKAVVIGHSLGGGIAAQLALLHPEKIDRLVLVDSAGYEKVPERWGAINIPVFDRFVARFFIVNRFAALHLLTKAFFDDKLVSNEIVDQFLRPSYVKDSLQVLIKMTLDQKTEDFPNKIKEIKQKTFVIWGREDAMIGAGDAERFHFDIKNSQMVIIPEVGHLPFMELPAQFNSYLSEFLK